MIERDRFRSRAQELRIFADQMTTLAKVPDRTTGADLQRAADLTRKAADSLDELLKGSLPGCICRRIENDNYSYLDYAEACQHHSQLHTLRERLKADYEKAEKALKNETRLQIVGATLAGIATRIETPDVETCAKRAVEVADAVIRQIAG